MGFRASADAPTLNLLYNALLYLAFIAVHIVMTMPAFKRTVFGRPEGTPFERRIYVTISVLSWVAVYAFHRPTPGFAYASPPWLQYAGYCAMLLGLVAFFEFATFEGLAKLVAMPGASLSHSVGAETPLMTEGPYAVVRHPMYRAALFVTFCSLLIHPNTCQLQFALMTTASFFGFIPFEEYQLLRARGDEYRRYMQTTPYRIFRGVW
jgi:protein-S-isoprenylcysteine O-methyltransferase Ste14